MQIWGVSDVTHYVKQVIENDPSLSDVWVEGEISNFTVAMSGHCYFTLKDATSQLKCVMFRHFAQRLRKRPGNGDVGVARGPIRVYESQGVYQLYAEFLAPAGMGELQLRLEELRLRLEGEGLFEPSRKRALPTWPRRIGVVTSATGAVIHDVRTVISRRFPLVEIVLAPSPVQGDEAVPGVCQAIDDLNRFGDVDVIIIARGGGSREDLGAFNAEAVARAIFGSRAPVVSAIGHETDVTIADLVADQRAPTPSAAAEMVVPDIREVRERLSALARMLELRVTLTLDQTAARVGQVADVLDRVAPTEHIRRCRTEIDDYLKRATLTFQHLSELRQEQVRARELQLLSLDPHAVLRRGFSVCRRADTGEVITRIGQVAVDVTLTTEVGDGTFTSIALGARSRE